VPATSPKQGRSTLGLMGEVIFADPPFSMGDKMVDEEDSK